MQLWELGMVCAACLNDCGEFKCNSIKSVYTPLLTCTMPAPMSPAPSTARFWHGACGFPNRFLVHSVCRSHPANVAYTHEPTTAPNTSPVAVYTHKIVVRPWDSGNRPALVSHTTFPRSDNYFVYSLLGGLPTLATSCHSNHLCNEVQASQIGVAEQQTTSDNELQPAIWTSNKPPNYQQLLSERIKHRTNNSIMG